MPYIVDIVQSEVNVTFKFGSFNFKKNQIITDENLGKELMKSFPRIFKQVSATAPVVPETPKVEEVIAPVVVDTPKVEEAPVIEEVEESSAENVDDITEEEETTEETATGIFSPFKKRGRKKGNK